MPQNTSKLKKAKAVKNDEFYTQLEDIENEVKNYWPQLKGKKIWCNCDDPSWSKFNLFFEGQKEYRNVKVKYSYYQPEHQDPNYIKEPIEKWITKKDLNGEFITIDENNVDEQGYCKGDFRAKEQQALWEWADVIVTNPPFSLFREFIDYIMKYNKKFIIIGPKGAIGYKEIFKLIKENKIWLGHNLVNNFVGVNNAKTTSPAVWFTNLKTKTREEYISLAKWEEGKFPKYENYDAYETVWLYGEKRSGKAQIPFTNKILGVPITFLTKYNPEQFEILGATPIDCVPDKFMKVTRVSGQSIGDTATRKGNIYLEVSKEKAQVQEIETGKYFALPFGRIMVKLTDKYYEKYKGVFEDED